jgi:uncharacterized membrane protein YczE
MKREKALPAEAVNRSVLKLSGGSRGYILMKKTGLRILRLFVGYFLFSTGIVMTINANLGLAPWDVFHQGVSSWLGITMGQANIGVGAAIVILNWLSGERTGWGTVGNMFFIGLFLDILMINKIIPVFQNIFLRLAMMCLGMFVIGVATYLYLGSGLGSGPRDGLMVSLTKRTNKSVRLVRNTIETTVLVLGYIMGGTVGVGTLIMALTTGFFVQLAFELFRFDVSRVQHRFIDDDIRVLKRKLQRARADTEI